MGDNPVLQYYVLLNRCTDMISKKIKCARMTAIEIELSCMLQKYKQIKDWDTISKLFILTILSRDIYFGHGERKIAYLLLHVWYCFFPDLAKLMIRCFISSPNKKSVGSWRDIREICYIMYDKHGSEIASHGIIEYCVLLYVTQIQQDIKQLQNKSDINHNISFAAKWCPRERGKHIWLFKKIAIALYANIHKISITDVPYTKAAKILRKRVSTLCANLNIVERNLCTKRYKNIDFHDLPIHSHFKYMNWLNRRNGTVKDELCDRYSEYIKQNQTQIVESSSTISYLHFIRKAVEYKDYHKDSQERIALHMLWKAKLFETNEILKNTLPLIDISRHMENNDNIPLYNAIGMAIHTSQISSGVINSHIMVYSNDVHWINVYNYHDLTDVVNAILDLPRGNFGTIHTPIIPLYEGLSSTKCTESDCAAMTIVFYTNLVHSDIISYMDHIFANDKWNLTPPKCVIFNVGTQSEIITQEQQSIIQHLQKEKNVSYLTGYNIKPLIYTLINSTTIDQKVIQSSSIKHNEKKFKTPEDAIEKLIGCNRYKNMYNQCYHMLFMDE